MQDIKVYGKWRYGLIFLNLKAQCGERSTSCLDCYTRITFEQETWVGPRTYLHRPFGEEINLTVQDIELLFLGHPAD